MGQDDESRKEAGQPFLLARECVKKKKKSVSILWQKEMSIFPLLNIFYVGKLQLFTILETIV